MEIIRLPLGESAPIDADCISLAEGADGRCELTTSALCTGEDEGESVSIVVAPAFATVAEAEAAGINWATDVGVARLYISHSTPTTPLAANESDGPL